MRRYGKASGASLPADWPRRIELIQRFFEDVKLSPGPSHGDFVWTKWPFRLGPGAATGRMPQVDPVMTQDDGWSTPLPGTKSLDFRQLRDLQKIMKRQSRPPIWQAVSDGQRLFVTCPAGLAALDLATFDFLWQAFPKFVRRDPKIDQHRRLVLRQGARIIQRQGQTFTIERDDTGNRLDEFLTRTLFWEHRGEVSTALGLVFVIEQDGTPNEQRPTLDGVMPANAHLTDEDLSEPNTLRAYEADTGRLAWTKGRGAAPEDPLRYAHFYGTPIVAGANLIVPYLQRHDLVLAVLKADGTLVRRVLLGSGRTGMFPMNGTLQPTVFDGTVYVPTGAGRLFALNEYDCSLRWLTKYERTDTIRHLNTRGQKFRWGGRLSIPQPDEWLSSPPIVIGGLVLLAPQDSDRLWAFDQQSGKRKWSFPRRNHRYIVGADERRIVLTGARIETVDLATGHSLWKSEMLHPTGRPAISGNHVLVPTAKGLIRLDLETGEPVGKRLSSSKPLGNLFVLDGSLYSVGAEQISKFPDPDQTRALALARLEQNPTDVEAVLRLVWLAMLSKDWSGARARAALMTDFEIMLSSVMKMSGTKNR